MDRFKEIRRQEIVFAVFMGAVLFIVGSASVYFVFVVQNAYLVRRTLDEMRTYTRNVSREHGKRLDHCGPVDYVSLHTIQTRSEILRKAKEDLDGKLISEILPVEDEIRKVLSDPDSIFEKEVKVNGDGKGKNFLALTVSPLKDTGVSKAPWRSRYPA